MRGYYNMSYTIPTFSQLFADHLSRLESNLNQDSPLNDFAFLRILAAVEAGQDIGLYKYAADAAKQNLALTATNTGLDLIGNNYNTPRKQAQAAIIEADLTATTGTVIPINTVFVANTSGLRYKTTAEVTAAAGTAALTMKCVETGTDGNLDVSDTLLISSQISGAETEATVTGTDTLGVNEETDADYRPRVLFAVRAITGGANATDHKIWAEAVTGVRRAFPFAGRPASEGTSYPGDRTVYVEATTTVDADGIAPSSLLDAVRDAINTDPDTGESRSVLGLTDDTLFVESITRTAMYVKMYSLDVDAAQEAALKSDMEDAHKNGVDAKFNLTVYPNFSILNTLKPNSIE